jgi:hypothetical protein
MLTMKSFTKESDILAGRVLSSLFFSSFEIIY